MFRGEVRQAASVTIMNSATVIDYAFPEQNLLSVTFPSNFTYEENGNNTQFNTAYKLYNQNGKKAGTYVRTDRMSRDWRLQ
jgi:hypothetical protein